MRPQQVVALVVLAALGGCGGGRARPVDSIDGSLVDSAAGDGGDGDGYGSGCSLLDDEACAADPSCRPISSQAIVADESCALPPAISGCTARNCNGPTVRALDAYNREFLILGGCLAYGWTPSAGRTTLAACAACDPLSIVQCKATQYCQVVAAQPIDDLRSCLQASQDVGCALVSRRCGAADTRATDPAGKGWAVPKACVPPGWSAAGGIPNLLDCAYPTGPEVCASLSARDCPLDGSCRLLRAKPIDTGRSCALATQPVGCTRADATCGDDITRARDEHQTSWIFPTTCIPTNWTNEATGPLVSDCPPGDGGTD